jgi:hypothetical protein
LSPASRYAPTGTSTARSTGLALVRDAVRDVLLVLRVVRVPALAGLRLVVVRFVVVERFCAPGLLVAIALLLLPVSSLSHKPIEHVFVHERLARVTHPDMTFL